MRILVYALLACATSANAQVIGTYDTCTSANSVTELDAGGVALPRQDATFEIDRTAATRLMGVYSFEPSANLDIVVAICNEPPSPLSRCFYIDDGGDGQIETQLLLEQRRYYLVVEATPASNLSCGQFTVVEHPPLD